MNNLGSVIAVALFVGFFTLAVRSMNHAWHTKAGVEFGPAGDRKAVKMAGLMLGGMERPSARHARVPLHRELSARERVPAPVVRRQKITEPPPAAVETSGFSKDLKAEWRAKIPKVPSLSGLEVPEVPNILDEPETRSDLPR